jgi:hypothetical protein
MIKVDSKANENYLLTFFKKLLVINAIFFILRIVTKSIFIVLYNNTDNLGHVTLLDNLVLQIITCIGFIVLFMFYLRTVKRGVEIEDQLIVKTWFFSYMLLLILGPLIINGIKYTIFHNEINTREYVIFSNIIPYLYIGLSAMATSIVLYFTGSILNITLIRVTAYIYPIITVLIMLLPPQDLSINDKLSIRLYIVKPLYNLQYIGALFIIFKAYAKAR